MKFNNIIHIEDAKEGQQIFLAAVKHISTTVHYNFFTDAHKALEDLQARKVTAKAIFLDLNSLL